MNDWYLGSDDWEFPSGASRCSASPTPRRSARRRRAGPGRSLRTCRSRSWPTTPWTSGSAGRTCRAREPGHGRRGRRRPPQPRREEQRRGRQAAAPQARRDARRPGDAQAPPAGPQPLPAQEHADRRDRPPGRHRPVRPPTRPVALDANCKAHDLDNLYVVDTSFFPSIGAVNPSLTAIANALRVGDHLDRAPGPS